MASEKEKPQKSGKRLKRSLLIGGTLLVAGGGSLLLHQEKNIHDINEKTRVRKEQILKPKKPLSSEKPSIDKEQEQPLPKSQESSDQARIVKAYKREIRVHSKQIRTSIGDINKFQEILKNGKYPDVPREEHPVNSDGIQESINASYWWIFVNLRILAEKFDPFDPLVLYELSAENETELKEFVTKIMKYIEHNIQTFKDKGITNEELEFVKNKYELTSQP